MNIDKAEIGKFESLADRWWDPEGDFKPLHDINPTRLDYIDEHAGLAGSKVLDVGCGGGILSESMAARGALVTGIDMAESPLMVARLHALEAGTHVDYEATTAEELAQTHPASFDIVSCLEMLEHVPDYSSVVDACATMTRPGGALFFSTINRHPFAYVTAVLGAEYILNLLPRGTHDFDRFIRPAELARAVRHAGLQVREIVGMQYNPFSRRCSLTRDLKVNYLLHATKP
jgi:2-polyprenyl-6-hydroxyphenyl methylase/3-demethylubiquinone-9 3-methyltransferase